MIHFHLHRFSGCDKELLLRKDDLVKFVKKDDDWSLVEHAVTGVRGHVPNAFIAPNLTLEAEPWFFGKISRAKVGTDTDVPLLFDVCFNSSSVTFSDVCFLLSFLLLTAGAV
jgi:hypothetical protein